MDLLRVGNLGDSGVAFFFERKAMPPPPMLVGWLTQQVVPALKEGHGAELRERSVDGESASASVEERVLTASLRSINAEDRRGVAALFDFCAIFAEDATVPPPARPAGPPVAPEAG